MYSMVKRVSVFALALLTLVMGVVVPFRMAEAAMMYNNTNSATISSYVDSNGNLNAALNVDGKKGITSRIEVEVYVEKRILGLFWTRVDIGCENNTWTDLTYNYNYVNTFQTHLSSTGTYRTTVTYYVYGSGGTNDTITKTDTVTY